jgi:hypothetical protein
VPEGEDLPRSADQPSPSDGVVGAGAPTQESAAPSVRARLLAFLSIVAAGAAGGFIGWAFVDLQCEDDCTVLAGVVGLITAVAAAVGVGVVAVLALRAIGEWKATQADGAGETRDPGLVLRRTATSRRQVPRVR